jgi:GNAT superfamily N-acetyltransferase
MTADYGLAIQNHIIDLLLDDDLLVGLIELVVEPHCVLIENVAVRPNEVGKGHGRRLMAHAVDVARSLGRRRLRLYTHKLMVENIELYRRLGYMVDGEEVTPDGRHVVYMSMEI